jgi:outer membrane protein assembly factor BamB
VTVTTAQYGNARTGANLNEVSLNTDNVNTDTFGKLFSRPVDDSVYALPLYIPQVTIPGGDTHNVVYVATVSNTVYAFDADDPAQSEPLWVRNLGPAPPVSGDLQTKWGILGTPVIDNGTMYLVAYIGETTESWSMYLCALDITTGADRFGPPSEILFPLAGTLTSATPFTIQRAGLLVSQGTLYIGLANYQVQPPDRASQEGFVFSYASDDISQPTHRFQVTNGQGGDIWQASRGLAADEDGYVYASTGNGFYDGVMSFGDSVLKLGQNLDLADWFTPRNWAQLYANDLDVSASGPILIPHTDYLVAGGKEGVLYLLRRSQLGKLQDSDSGGAVEYFHATNGCYLTNCSQTLSMAYWDRPWLNGVLYVWDRRDVLRAFLFSGERLQESPSQTGNLASEMVGGISLSSRGSMPGTGIVWATTAAENGNQAIVHGTLRAYDAANIQHELWNSDLLTERDSMGNFTKFASPVVANGKVYVVTQSNQLQVYGLLSNTSVVSQ